MFEDLLTDDKSVLEQSLDNFIDAFEKFSDEILKLTDEEIEELSDKFTDKFDAAFERINDKFARKESGMIYE